MTSPIYATYHERTQSSAENYAKTRWLMPGGTSRQASFRAPYPLTIAHGSGAHFQDVDGNRYLDLLNSDTALVHGHAYPTIVEASRKQVRLGTGWAAANEPQIRFAQTIGDRVPSIEPDLTMVAGEISLRELSPERIKQMNRLRDKLQSGLSESAKRYGLPISISHYESCMNIFMSESVPVSSVVREDQQLMDKYNIACLNHGLLIAPRGLVALSTVLTDDDIAAAVQRADAAMQDLAAESG